MLTAKQRKLQKALLDAYDAPGEMHHANSSPLN